MKANSKGSVTPHTKEAIAADSRMPMATLRFSGLALRYIAKAAAGTPNIMQGKKPDMYIPTDQVISVPLAMVSP